MNLRAKSKARQWLLWLGAGLAGLAVYVVLSRILYGSMSWNVVLPRNQRIVLPVLAFFWLFAWETRWDEVKRTKEVKGEGRGQGGEAKAKGEEGGLTAVGSARSATSGATSFSVPQKEEADTTRHGCYPPPSNTPASLSPIDDDETGEALFDRARAMRHQPIPDFKNDAEYLDLLGRSAAKGYSPAQSKLGEYAMRRAAWVEAYYWMKQAQRNGMHGLSPILLEIRKNWSRDGFPEQNSNVNRLFSPEAGSLGRALLHVDFGGYGAGLAKKFIRVNHPEFLT